MIDPLNARKKYPLAWGIVPCQSDKYAPDIGACVRQQGAISGGGGHGVRGCHWPLAVVLMQAQTLQVAIVGIYLRNAIFCLNYLDRSKLRWHVRTCHLNFRIFHIKTQFILGLDWSKSGLNHLDQFWQSPSIHCNVTIICHKTATNSIKRTNIFCWMFFWVFRGVLTICSCGG